MEIRKSLLAMIRAVTGGWDVSAAHLGMSRSSLDNRVYERKGQQLSTDDALQLQILSGTTLFAEAVAARSGGVFVAIPGVGEETDKTELLSKFEALAVRFGRLAQRHAEATADGEIDQVEKQDLIACGNSIHQAVEELLHYSFRLHCKPEPTAIHPGGTRIGRVADL